MQLESRAPTVLRRDADRCERGVTASISDLSSSTLPWQPREGGGIIHPPTHTPHTHTQPPCSREDGHVGKRWSAVKAPCDTDSGGRVAASLALELPSLPTDKDARVAPVSAHISQVVDEVGGRLEREQAKRDSKRDLSLAFSEGLSSSFLSLNGDADLGKLASNRLLLSPASSPRVTPQPIPPPPSRVQHQHVHVEYTDENEQAAYEPEDASDEVIARERERDRERERERERERARERLHVSCRSPLLFQVGQC